MPVEQNAEVAQDSINKPNLHNLRAAEAAAKSKDSCHFLTVHS